MVGTTGPTTDSASKRRKKKDKVRSAWISFVGRIVAQVIGATASVILGLMMLGNYHDRTAAAAPAAAPSDHLTRHREARAGELAIAVLPLQNYSADPKHAYVADGLTETLITDLAQIRGLRVMSRTSSMAYKGSTKPVPHIARELAVDLLLEGSVVLADQRVRVTAQLIDADSDEHIWAKSYDREVGDLLALQSEVSAAIASAVNLAISPRLAQWFTAPGGVGPAD